MIFLPDQSLQELVKNRFPQVQSIKFKKQFFHTINAVIFFSKPVIAISSVQQPNGSVWYLLDAQYGLVGQTNTPSMLPRLEVPPSQWQFIDHVYIASAGTKAVTLLRYLSVNYPQITGQLSLSFDLRVTIGHTLVIFSTDKDPAVSVATLQLALRDPTIQKSPPAIIDLRFQNPVLSY